MIAIREIISHFSQEEHEAFLQYLKVRNKRKDAKNVSLYKLLVSDTSAKKIPELLYGEANKSAYHGLRKRLWKSLVDFMASKSLSQEVSEDVAVFKYILVARNLLFQKQHKTAFKMLRKAEKQAREMLHFSLLNEIYHTQIQYAHTLPNEIEVESIIEKFEQNQHALLQEEKLNMAYAMIKQKLQKVVYKGEILPLKDLVSETFDRFHISDETGKSYKSLYQLAQIINATASVSVDYAGVSLFIVQNYHEISATLQQSEKHLFYHIKILYLIANIFFRKKQFSESLAYLEKMYVQMQLQKKQFYNENKFRYQCLLALNENYSGNSEKAISLLEAILPSKKYDLETMLDIHLSLVVFYFQQSEFKKAYKILSKLYHSDAWYEGKVGVNWVLKKNLIELLLHIELGNISLVDSRMKSFQRKHAAYLKKVGEWRVLTFLKLVKKYYQSPESVTSEAFKETVEASFDWKPRAQEDIFVMSFYAWLKAKMTKAAIYKTTLALIHEE